VSPLFSFPDDINKIIDKYYPKIYESKNASLSNLTDNLKAKKTVSAGPSLKRYRGKKNFLRKICHP